MNDELRTVLNLAVNQHFRADCWHARNGICVLDQMEKFCTCEQQAKEAVRLAIQTAEDNGWKLIAREPTEDMATAANVSTSAWQNIQGSQMTVNLEKAKIRWRAMFDKAEGG